MVIGNNSYNKASNRTATAAQLRPVLAALYYGNSSRDILFDTPSHFS